MKLSKTNLNFLSRIGASVFACSNGKTDMRYVPSLEEGLKQNTNYDADLYFIANPSTGMKESSVRELSCNFVDFDAGRPTETSYFDNKTVKKYKDKVIRAVLSAEFRDLRPTYIVETRNGYHMYWVYDTRVTATASNLHKWKLIEKYLVTRFANLGADQFVIKPNQLLRVPGSMWRKRWEGCVQFTSVETRILETKKIRPTYKFTNLVKLAERDIDSFSDNVLVAKSLKERSSYQPSQDVNRGERFPKIIQSKKKTLEESDTSDVEETSDDNTQFLLEVVALLKAIGMTQMSSKLSKIIKNI